MTEQTRFEKTKNLSVSFSEETIKDTSITGVKQLDEISISEVPSEEALKIDSCSIMNESISSAIPLSIVNDLPFVPRKRPNNVRNETSSTKY